MAGVIAATSICPFHSLLVLSSNKIGEGEPAAKEITVGIDGAQPHCVFE